MNNSFGSNVLLSLWEDTMHSSPQFHLLATSIEADVCVVGAGISGLTTAYFLQKAGKKVVVLDAREIGGGETALTTAHLASVLDDGFENLKKLFGLAGAKLAVESHQTAIELIEQIIKQEHIDCDFSWVNGYLFSDTESTDKQLEEEYIAAQELGYAVKKVVISVAQLESKHALAFAKQAQFHPLKYLYALAKAFIKHGGQIYAHTKVETIEERDNKVLCHVHNGKVVTADFGVVATNTPFLDRFEMHTKQAAYRSYVIGLEIEKHAIPLALYWDIQDPYHYVRVYERKEATTDILLVGGEDHKTGQGNAIEEKFAHLEEWTRNYFPQLGPCLYRWSGQIMEPIDSLAFIGLNPGNKRIFIVTGDSGHGLTHGTIAGRLITDLIEEKDNPWRELYNPARKNIQAVKTFLHENINVAYQYSSVLKKSDVKKVGDIKAGEGAVMKKGLYQCAIYRDTKGKLHTMSANCPHLGCIVQWNNAEKSWDCPCHGSRFAAQGEVINGPAITAMKKI